MALENGDRPTSPLIPPAHSLIGELLCA